jgi:hypothetical protein
VTNSSQLKQIICQYINIFYRKDYFNKGEEQLQLKPTKKLNS